MPRLGWLAPWIALAPALAGSPGCLRDAVEPVWEPPAFPPTDLTVTARSGFAVDLDGDGVDDAVIANATGDSASRGFFVLRGRRDADIGGTYDAFVNTPDIEPYAILAGALGGDSSGDVAIFGERPSDELAHLVVVPGLPGLEFGDPLAKLLWAEEPLPGLGDPEVSPPFFARGDFDGDAFPDLVLGNNADVFVVEVEAWGESFAANSADRLATPDGGPEWNDAIGALAVPGDNNDDLLIARDIAASLYVNAGGATPFGDTIHTTDLPPDEAAFDGAIAYGDVSCDGVPDVLSAGYQVLVASDVAPGRAYCTGDGGDFTGYVDVLAVQLDANAAPEMVGIDLAAATPFARMYHNLGCYTSTECEIGADPVLQRDREPLSVDLGELGCSTSAFGLTGDFDGDAQLELLVVCETGVTACFELRQTGFHPCL